jgi:hypothetical protein
MVSTYHEMGPAPSQVCAFYDLSSALKWLGLDENWSPDDSLKTLGTDSFLGPEEY